MLSTTLWCVFFMSIWEHGTYNFWTDLSVFILSRRIIWLRDKSWKKSEVPSILEHFVAMFIDPKWILFSFKLLFCSRSDKIWLPRISGRQQLFCSLIEEWMSSFTLCFFQVCANQNAGSLVFQIIIDGHFSLVAQ